MGSFDQSINREAPRVKGDKSAAHMSPESTIQSVPIWSRSYGVLLDRTVDNGGFDNFLPLDLPFSLSSCTSYIWYLLTT